MELYQSVASVQDDDAMCDDTESVANICGSETMKLPVTLNDIDGWEDVINDEETTTVARVFGSGEMNCGYLTEQAVEPTTIGQS